MEDLDKIHDIKIEIIDYKADSHYLSNEKVSFTLTTVSDVARGLLLTADGRQHEDGEGHQPHARRVAAQHVTRHCSLCFH